MSAKRLRNRRSNWESADPKTAFRRNMDRDKRRTWGTIITVDDARSFLSELAEEIQAQQSRHAQRFA